MSSIAKKEEVNATKELMSLDGREMSLVGFSKDEIAEKLGIDKDNSDFTAYYELIKETPICENLSYVLPYFELYLLSKFNNNTALFSDFVTKLYSLLFNQADPTLFVTGLEKIFGERADNSKDVLTVKLKGLNDCVNTTKIDNNTYKNGAFLYRDIALLRDALLDYNLADSDIRAMVENFAKKGIGGCLPEVEIRRLHAMGLSKTQIVCVVVNFISVSSANKKEIMEFLEIVSQVREMSDSDNVIETSGELLPYFFTLKKEKIFSDDKKYACDMIKALMLLWPKLKESGSINLGRKVCIALATGKDDSFFKEVRKICRFLEGKKTNQKEQALNDLYRICTERIDKCCNDKRAMLKMNIETVFHDMQSNEAWDVLMFIISRNNSSYGFPSELLFDSFSECFKNGDIRILEFLRDIECISTNLKNSQINGDAAIKQIEERFVEFTDDLITSKYNIFTRMAYIFIQFYMFCIGNRNYTASLDEKAKGFVSTLSGISHGRIPFNVRREGVPMIDASCERKPNGAEPNMSNNAQQSAMPYQGMTYLSGCEVTNAPGFLGFDKRQNFVFDPTRSPAVSVVGQNAQVIGKQPSGDGFKIDSERNEMVSNKYPLPTNVNEQPPATPVSR